LNKLLYSLILSFFLISPLNVSGDSLCLISLTKMGKGFVAVGSPSVNFSDCKIYVNSPVALKGGGAISAAGFFTTGEAQIFGSFVSVPIETNVLPIPDPWGSLVPPDFSDSDWPKTHDLIVTDETGLTVLVPEGQAIFEGGIFINDSDVIFDSGVVAVVGGDLVISGNSNVTFPDNTILLSDQGNLYIGPRSTVTITAPATGPFQGLAIYHTNPTATSKDEIFGSLYLDGAIYNKSGKLALNANASLNYRYDQTHAGITVGQIELGGKSKITEVQEVVAP
jgi:hypothetical protein